MGTGKSNSDFTEGLSQQNSVVVEILGTKYLIKGDADSDYIKKIANYVDGKMRRIKENSPAQTSVDKLSILTALDITDELFREKAERQRLMAEIDRRAGKLARLLEQQMNKMAK